MICQSERMTGITRVREYGKDMWLIDAEKLYDDLANDLKWIMGDGSNGEDLDTYAHVGNTIRETFNDQEVDSDKREASRK